LNPKQLDLLAPPVPDLSSHLYPCKEVTVVLLLQPRSTPPPTRAAPGTVPLRVLVVEDDADTADSYVCLLQLQRLEVRTAPDGPTALAVAQTFLPEVVLLDIGMPGLDGWEVARRLKAESADKPPFLIAITGYGQPEDRQKSAEAGIDLHLVKPADPRMLVGLLERFQEVAAEGAPPVIGTYEDPIDRTPFCSQPAATSLGTDLFWGPTLPWPSPRSPDRPGSSRPFPGG
jgi:CheY-like chemotaxis protein